MSRPCWRRRSPAAKKTASTLVAVDAKTGKVVAEAGVKMTPRLAKKLIEEGRLGKIFHYRSVFLQDWTIAADLPQGGQGLWRLDVEAAVRAYTAGGPRSVGERPQTLEPGQRADLVLCRVEGKKIHIQRVYLAGRLLYSAEGNS